MSASSRFSALTATAALALGLAACSPSSPSTSSPATAPATSSAAEGATEPTRSESAAAASTSAGASAPAPTADGDQGGRPGETALVTATTTDLGDPQPETPSDLVKTLQGGGNVIVFRYTGATTSGEKAPAIEGSIDDGQRVSPESVQLMRQMGDKYKELGIPVGQLLSSEYFFVNQHATAAFDRDVPMSRDLTGSLYFDDPAELESSLQGLRNRTVTPPADESENTVLFTHQGKFDKAWGYYPDAGTTLVFRPDGSGEPKLIANLTLDELLALEG